ncbi:hypothetical protein JMJ77_0010144 [Colletotrichum scovillei]|uniref:Uncharacterized protein n=1 Tax=Colletotrichum scovillei TaxID=1209932 RepID=A0A9P7QT19_9PEZI|nr:hypothetical protein JMJ78_0011522 [Colletotrichum scovillei]KAG7042038.1 hypothetical protein JMJ77_0010144 [Colletotrichum scovillei]KAG7062069.1 hypothetical protein JMJ76_0006351 [Colletotrichum scovillei]
MYFFLRNKRTTQWHDKNSVDEVYLTDRPDWLSMAGPWCIVREPRPRPMKLVGPSWQSRAKEAFFSSGILEISGRSDALPPFPGLP